MTRTFLATSKLIFFFQINLRFGAITNLDISLALRCQSELFWRELDCINNYDKIELIISARRNKSENPTLPERVTSLVTSSRRLVEWNVPKPRRVVALTTCVHHEEQENATPSPAVDDWSRWKSSSTFSWQSDVSLVPAIFQWSGKNRMQIGYLRFFCPDDTLSLWSLHMIWPDFLSCSFR